MTDAAAFIYIMTTRSSPGWVKVGFTDRDVEQRRRELSSATGVKDPFKIAHVVAVPAGTGQSAERLAHQALASFTRRKEFFKCSHDQAIHLITCALAPLMHASTIDVREARAAVEAAWRAKKDAYVQMSQAREAHEIARAEMDASFYQDRAALEAGLRHAYSARLIINRILAAIVVILICGIAWILVSPGLVWALVLLGIFWIPLTVLKAFPVAADELPEFKERFSQLQEDHKRQLQQAGAALSAQKAALRAAIDAHDTMQREAESKLRSFRLSPRFRGR